MEQKKTPSTEELTERLGIELRQRKLFRKLEEFTKKEGLNGGMGYSYSYIRKVLLYPEMYGHKNQRIVLAGYDLLWRIEQEERKNEQLIIEKAEKLALTA